MSELWKVILSASGEKMAGNERKTIPRTGPSAETKLLDAYSQVVVGVAEMTILRGGEKTKLITMPEEAPT